MSKKFKSATSSVIVTVTPDIHGALIETAGGSESLRAISVSAKTAPAFTLSILEAAGWPDEARTSITRTILQDLRFVVDCVEKDAKEAADREAQTKRRDDLAKELGASRTYTTYRQLSGTSQRAIDRIIELEDRATK